jgi:hypothetical protein
MLPKKIQIADKTILVKVDRSRMGSDFNPGNNTITLGVKGVAREERLNSFLHEVIEAIFEIRKMCYQRPYLESEPDSSDYLYIMSHDDLNTFVSDLVLVLESRLHV